MYKLLICPLLCLFICTSHAQQTGPLEWADFRARVLNDHPVARQVEPVVAVVVVRRTTTATGPPPARVGAVGSKYLCYRSFTVADNR